jgi:hypothetical protein
MKHELHNAGIAMVRTDGRSAEDRQTVMRLLRGASIRGRGIGEFPAAGLARLEVEEFAWPEFDRWRAFFAQREKFPPLWDEVKRIPNLRDSPEIRDAYRRHKFYLLLDWLQSLQASRSALAHYRERGVRAKITRQGDGARCPACDLFNHREVKDKQEELPPFHPGCRCLVVAISDVRVYRPAGRATHRSRNLRHSA